MGTGDVCRYEASESLPLNSAGVSDEGVQQHGDTPAHRFAIRREQGQACAEHGAGDPVNWTDLDRTLKQAWLQRWAYLRSFAPFGFTLSIIAALLVMGLPGCDFETRMGRLELLPDAEFELPMRWIPGYVFGSGMLSVPEYHLEVPAKSLPPGFLTSEYAISRYPKLDVGESSFDAGLQKHYMRIGVWKTPMPGEAMHALLNEVPVQGAHGWRRLPGALDSAYNVAGIPGSNQVFYEYKRDRRYTMRCWLYPVSTASMESWVHCEPASPTPRMRRLPRRPGYAQAQPR